MSLSKQDMVILQAAVDRCMDEVVSRFKPLVVRLPGMPKPQKYESKVKLDVSEGALQLAVTQAVGRMVIPMLIQFRNDTLALHEEIERLENALVDAHLPTPQIVNSNVIDLRVKADSGEATDVVSDGTHDLKRM